MMSRVTVVGGGLSGSEAAYQLAERGHQVDLYEMRPLRGTPAHQTDLLGGGGCTNSSTAADATHAHGLLKTEMRARGSILLRVAEEARVPGGTALGVGRPEFARRMTAAVESHPPIRIVREAATALPAGPTVIATGPLTS